MADFKDFVAGLSPATLAGTERVPVVGAGATQYTTPNAIATLASGAVSTHAALTTTHGISAFGATLVDDASASAARTTLGLGSAATLAAGTSANNVVQLDGSARLPAVDGSLLTNLPSVVSDHGAMTGLSDDDHAQYHTDARGDARYGRLPRVVTGSIASGVVTVDCANVGDVVVNLTLTANVTSVAYQNLPTVCRVRWNVTQSGGPYTFPANAHPAGTVVDGTYYLYTDATVTRMLWETADGGTSASLQTNAPIVGDFTPLTETLDGGGHEIGRYVNRVVTNATGALTAADHSGCVLVTSGNVTVPATTGFNAVIVAGGAHTITFNSTASSALAAGDVVTVAVESPTAIHAVKTAAANKLAFADLFLYEQDFDGTGTPSGWSSAGTVGAVDYDYATAPAPLFGTQSMSVYIPSSGYRNAIYGSFAAQSDVYVSFAVRNEILLIDGTPFFALRNSSDTAVLRLRVQSGNLTLRDATDTATVTLSAFALATTRILMVRYQKGTGANSTLTAWELSGGAWSELGQKTDGTGTTDASKLFFETNKGAEARLLVDRIRVSSSIIPASAYA